MTDFKQPLPPEPRRNLGILLEVPARVLEHAVLSDIAEQGFDGVRAAHGKVFATIAGEGSRLTDMAALALLTKQSMQYLVDDLERLGYAERVPDPADRRAKLVRLTPRGRQVVQAGRDAVAAVEADWERRLGKRKLGHLRSLLSELGPVALPDPERESP